MTHRTVMLAGMISLLPALATPAAANPVPDAGTVAPDQTCFAPPLTPLVLTRTLWRSLHDGKQIMVRRRYLVRFMASGEGYQLDGHQFDVTVDAPEQLALLAAIERRRSDDGMFPLPLDAQGRIAPTTALGPSAGSDPAAPFAAALALSRNMLDNSALPPATKSEAAQQLERIAATAGGQWPADLFSPLARDRGERLEIPLPGGGTGAVEIALRFVRDKAGHLPTTVDRTITTWVDANTRVSREEWTLAPAD